MYNLFVDNIRKIFGSNQLVFANIIAVKIFIGKSKNDIIIIILEHCDVMILLRDEY